MFIKENMLIRAVCDDGTVFTGRVYRIVIQLCEDDSNRPHALLFISQDRKYTEQDGEFDCASVWVDKLKSVEILPEEIQP